MSLTIAFYHSIFDIINLQCCTALTHTLAAMPYQSIARHVQVSLIIAGVVIVSVGKASKPPQACGEKGMKPCGKGMACNASGVSDDSLASYTNQIRSLIDSTFLTPHPVFFFCGLHTHPCVLLKTLDVRGSGLGHGDFGHALPGAVAGVRRHHRRHPRLDEQGLQGGQQRQKTQGDAYRVALEHDL